MKIRRFFHRIWAGHYPTYRVSSGGLLLDPYLYCVTCDEEDKLARQIRLEKLKKIIESTSHENL